MTWRERQAYIRPDLQGPERMKSFVINLDRASERLAHLDVTFGRHGLSFTRMAAVDAKLLTPREIAERCTPDAKLGVSELACFLSHRKCWQAIVDLAIPHAVIFEDDVLLGKDAAEILNQSDWIPPQAALIKLETNARPTIVEKAIEGSSAGRTLRRLRGPHFNACAYVVSRDGALALLAASERVDRPVDLFLFDESGLDRLVTYQLAPALCIQPFVARRLDLEHGDPTLMASAVDEDRKARRPRGLKRVGHKLRRLGENVRVMLRGVGCRLGRRHEWGPVPFI